HQCRSYKCGCPPDHLSFPTRRSSDLAEAQRWVLGEIVARLPVEPPAHGFVPGRSIVTNASPHCRRAVVVNMDLEGFFPSIGFPRDRKSTRLNSSHDQISYAVFCLQKK